MHGFYCPMIAKVDNSVEIERAVLSSILRFAPKSLLLQSGVKGSIAKQVLSQLIFTICNRHESGNCSNNPFYHSESLKPTNLVQE